MRDASAGWTQVLDMCVGRSISLKSRGMGGPESHDLRSYFNAVPTSGVGTGDLYDSP